MKKTTFTIAYILLFLFANQAIANNYVWIHGDKNNDNCWKLYDDAFTKGISSRVKYGFSDNIPNTAEGIWQANNLNNNTGNILIGYSVGGLIAREIENTHSSKIKGIITLGTPHDGIATYSASSGINYTYNELRGNLMGAWNMTAGTTLPIVGNVIISEVFINSEKDYLKNLPYYNNTNLDNYSTLEKNSIKNSSYMKSIDSRKVNVPILCFAAEEDRWQLARTLYCGKNMDNLQSNSDINADGSYDQTGYNQMNQMAQNCTVMGVGHTALAVGFAALGAFVNPYFFILSGTNGLAAAAWYSNTSYINNSLDFNHAVYVGAFRYEDRTDCRQFLWWKTCTTKTYTIPESHDGIVSVKSQYLATTKGTNVIIPAATIKNVNHMEEFNHKNTKAEFSNAIEKGTYGPTFKKN